MNESSLESRINEHLTAIAEIGRDPLGGWTRLAFSDAETVVHNYARDVFSRADYGLTFHEDAFGNLIGTTGTANSDDEGTVVIGTHLDTVTKGGNYDGVVGFIVGVETVRELRKNCSQLPNLEVIIFRAEESTRFKKSCLGSRAMFQGLTEEELGLSFERDDGQVTTLADALKSLTGDVPALGTPTVNQKNIVAYFETHIEQARVLEAYQKSLIPSNGDQLPSCVGIVTSIRAPHRCRWEITGVESPTLRLLAACVLGVETVAELCAKSGLDIVATIGRVEGNVKGADKINAVPGNVSIPVTDQIDDYFELVEKLVTHRGCSAELGTIDKTQKNGIELIVQGLTDHSGGSPMGRDSRRDALAALCEAILYLSLIHI